MSYINIGNSKLELTEIKRIGSDKGELLVLDQTNGIPFEPKRFFYAKNMQKGDKRGGHAHIKLEQFLWVIRGKFKVRLVASDSAEVLLTLEENGKGLYIPVMTWVEYWAEKEDSICGVLASDIYAEDDYIRDFKDFIQENT